MPVDCFTLKDLTIKVPSQREDDPTEEGEEQDD
mgnify:CR=1 FL=1